MLTKCTKSTDGQDTADCRAIEITTDQQHISGRETTNHSHVNQHEGVTVEQDEVRHRAASVAMDTGKTGKALPI